MGLFDLFSSKSSSASTTSSSQETTDRSVGGVLTDSTVLGDNSVYTQAFPENVANAFGQLVGLAEHSLEAVKLTSADALDTVEKSTAASLSVAAERTTISENPTAALANKFIPALTIAAVAVAAVMIFRTLKHG